MTYVLTLWTDDPGLAGAADAAGVDRVGLDLERLGKQPRQRGLDTWISPHRRDQLPALRATLRHAALFARCNPLNPGSREEVEELLHAGVEVLMLPNFTEVEEVAAFLHLVAGRAKVVPLLERLKAAHQVKDLVGLEGIDEVHVGLNDLAIDLGLRNRMAALTSDVLEHVAATVTGAGLRLGVGGIARARDESLPLPSDLVYAQHARLRTGAALIARSFFHPPGSAADLSQEIMAARGRLAHWRQASTADLDAAHAEFRGRLERPNEPLEPNRRGGPAAS